MGGRRMCQAWGLRVSFGIYSLCSTERDPGSTPLHFAAANGHAPIVQILLTCGASPDKSDKHGMTPEALAEVNGHTDVIRVLRVWEHLKLQETQSFHSSVGTTTAGPYSERGDVESLTGSTSQLGLGEENERFGSQGSGKGKERAMSIHSNVSAASTSRSQALRMKQSFEALFERKATRSTSAASESGGGEASQPREEVDSQVRLSTLSNETDPTTLASLMDLSDPILPPSAHGENAPPSGNATSVSPDGLARTTSLASAGSAPPIIMFDRTPPMTIGIPPTRRTTSVSSRRPTLPSIFERAAHPGAAFRAAIRRDNDPKSRSPPDRSPPSIEETSPRSASSSGSFFRGRAKSNEVPSRHHGRKYMSKQGIVQLFRRGNSPPSRSPSPPERTEAVTIIPPEELDERIERLKRASFDLDMRESRENSEIINSSEEQHRPHPASAPATKTRFFEDLEAPPVPPLHVGLYSSRRDERPPLSTSSSGSDRPRTNRTRTGSEVIAPSPLANEWAHDEDSDTAPHQGIRRVTTEVIESSPPMGFVDPSSPSSAMFTKPRSSTMPNVPGRIPRSLGSGWDDAMNLRKVASGVFRRENERQQEAEDTDVTEGEDDEFHDAIADVEESDVEKVENTLKAESSPAAQDIIEAGSEMTPAAIAIVQPGEVKVPDQIEQPTVVDELSGEVEEADVKQQHDLFPVRVEQQDPPKAPLILDTGRFRGASIGSNATQSSRISTAPGSSLRKSLITDEGSSERGSSDLPRRVGPPPPPPLVMSMHNGRQRGISVSSTSTSASGMALSYSPSASTPGTSLTPQSTLSIHLNGGFPPVPENEVAPHSMAQRKVFSRAEAANIVKQNEDDILQLAQLPPSLDSSRSLAAQLAAYGENHAIEQEFAEREAQATKGNDVDSSDNASYFSADESGRSAMSSPLSSERASNLGLRKCEPEPGGASAVILIQLSLARPPPSLLSVDAPRSSVPSINSIYDKRATAYRQRMMALTALPPISPSSTSSHRSRSRPRAATYADSWLNAGPSQRHSGEEPDIDHHPDISSPMPMSSSSLVPPHRKKPVSVRTNTSRPQSSMLRYGTPASRTMSRSLSPIALRLGSESQPHSPRTAPAPIADVVSTRFQGTPPPIPTQSALPPHISIFSNRYSGLPHDGGDSDDDEHEQRNYMLIENDWRGGHVVGRDVSKKGGKWGQFKGAIGHIGRRKGELS